MNSKRFPKLALQGRVEGKRKRGGQAKTWMDQITNDLGTVNLTFEDLKITYLPHRKSWRKRCKIKRLN
jgi:hypothetical protein